MNISKQMKRGFKTSFLFARFFYTSFYENYIFERRKENDREKI